MSSHNRLVITSLPSVLVSSTNTPTVPISTVQVTISILSLFMQFSAPVCILGLDYVIKGEDLNLEEHVYTKDVCYKSYNGLRDLQHFFKKRVFLFVSTTV